MPRLEAVLKAGDQKSFNSLSQFSRKNINSTLVWLCQVFSLFLRLTFIVRAQNLFLLLKRFRANNGQREIRIETLNFKKKGIFNCHAIDLTYQIMMKKGYKVEE